MVVLFYIYICMVCEKPCAVLRPLVVAVSRVHA